MFQNWQNNRFALVEDVRIVLDEDFDTLGRVEFSQKDPAKNKPQQLVLKRSVHWKAINDLWSEQQKDSIVVEG